MLLLWTAAARGAAHARVTNTVLWTQLAQWRGQVSAGQSARVVREIDAVVAGGAPWRAAVLHGDGWAYTWGFLALNTYGWACENTHDPVRAYRALANARAYMPSTPPPRQFAYDYWRWHVAMGELCARLGRTQDARWYFAHTRGNLTTNDGLYFMATAGLSDPMARQDDTAASITLFDELLNSRPWQPTRVWHDYIELLFGAGRFEEGVAAILRGARANGFSSRFVERDYFIVDASRYWHFFRELDVIEWYDFLGEKLERIRVTPANQALISLLINTRTLMKQAHPELLALPVEDVQALRERLSRERHRDEPPGSRRCLAGNVATGANGQSHATPIDTLTSSVTAGPAATTNALLEDAVNRILLDTMKVSRYTYGAPEPWLYLLRDYDTNTLATVIVDGVPARWLAHASLATIMSEAHKGIAATNWQAEALNNMVGVNNSERLADLCLWVAYVHLSPEMRNLERAEHFARWALALAPSNTRVRVDAQDKLAGLALLKGTPHDRIAILRDIVAQGGCTPRQAVYERLARDYFRTGQPREAVATLFEGMRRCVFKLEDGRFNHFIEALRCARSLLTAAEIDQLRTMLRSGAMRYPATVANISASVRAFALADAVWLNEQQRLARLEESAVYSEENCLWLAQYATMHPSVRAGRLTVMAQAARAPAGSNIVDWTGWLAGWRGVAKECQGPPTLGDTGVSTLLYATLLDVLERYAAGVSTNDQRSIAAALQELFGMPYVDDLRERAGKVVAGWGDTSLTFDFLLAHVRSVRNLAMDDPLVRQLLRMQRDLPESARGELAAHLRQRAAAEPDHSNAWLRLLAD